MSTAPATATLDENTIAAAAAKCQEELGKFWGSLDHRGKAASILGKTGVPKGSTPETAGATIVSFLRKEQGAIRVRVTEFGIINTHRIETGNELKSLHEHVEVLFQWFADPSTYAAPCKPLIQSSGTGKTKLLRDYRDYLLRSKKGAEGAKKKVEEGTSADAASNAAEAQIHPIFISCIEQQTPGTTSSKNVYDVYLTTSQIKNEPELTKALESIIQKIPEEKRIVMLFDEAQHLSQGSKNLFTLRKFLRKFHGEQKIVAVFAGTTASLANCYPTAEVRKSSRDGEATGDYRKAGHRLYDPIFELYTMGCFAGLILPSPSATEFERAIPYGRPLFARLLLEDPPGTDQCVQYPVQATKGLTNDDMAIILTRMLMNRTDPFQTAGDLSPTLSIWATRVQLGNIKEIVADTLLSRGYAHLTTYRSYDTLDDGVHPTFSLSYLPDPVCARLAMCMMTENYELTGASRKFTGRSKKEWVHKLGEVLASGMCGPPRGDLGEMMCAAYLLFVGDELREKMDKNLCKFSIPVDQWVQKLLGKPESDATVTGPEAMKTEEEEDAAYCTVNFIQFCRNSLRFGFKDVCRQDYLKFLYESCCATYAFGACPLYDAIAAIRTPSQDYVPLFMTIKTRDKYTNGNAVKLIDSIVKQLVQIEQKEALVLVVVLDHGKDTQDTAEEDTAHQKGATGGLDTWQKIATASRTADLKACNQMIVSRIVEIPTNDCFNLTHLVRKLTGKEEAGDVFSSHSFVGVFDEKQITGCRRTDIGNTNALLTKETTKEVQDKLSHLWLTRHKPSTEGNRKRPKGEAHATGDKSGY